jgi:hypothetical protein
MFSQTDTLTAYVETQIKENPVMVWSKTYCPFCGMAKGLFQDLEVQAKVIELDEIGRPSHMPNSMPFPHHKRESLLGACYQHDDLARS